MKVVAVCRRFDPAHWGGTETVVVETGRRLQARGHEVSVLASSALGVPGTIDVRGLPVERHAYAYPYVGLRPGARAALDNAGGNLVCWPLLARLLTMPRPDLVHLHTMGRLGGMVRWACAMRRIPYVVTLHGGHLTLPAAQQAIFTDPLRGALDLGRPLGLLFGSRNVLRDAAAVLALNGDEARACRAAQVGPLVLQATHGVDLARWRGPLPAGTRDLFRPGPGPRLLCVGRLDPQKGQDLLLPVVAALAGAHPGLQLVLVGSATDAAYAARLTASIEAAGLGGRIHVAGGVAPDDPRLAASYRAATCLVVPSRHEPFGLIVLEAWASGTPVVATRTGGLVDLLGDEERGWLAAPEDPASLTDAVRDVLARPDEAARRVAAGTARVEARHGWDAVVGDLEALYLQTTSAVDRAA